MAFVFPGVSAMAMSSPETVAVLLCKTTSKQRETFKSAGISKLLLDVLLSHADCDGMIGRWK